jgi:tRNA(fMet)-specific endonuclease VapC
LGELVTGSAGAMKERENKDVLRRFLLRPTVKVLNAISQTAEIFGFIKRSMRKAGAPLPINDAWIAAHAFEVGLRFVTYDEHNKKVAGL